MTGGCGRRVAAVVSISVSGCAVAWAVQTKKHMTAVAISVALSSAETDELMADQRKLSALHLFPAERDCSRDAGDVVQEHQADRNGFADTRVLALLQTRDCWHVATWDAAASGGDYLFHLARRRLDDGSTDLLARLNDARHLSVLAYSSQTWEGTISAVAILQHEASTYVKATAAGELAASEWKPVSEEERMRIRRNRQEMIILYLGLAPAGSVVAMNEIDGAIGRCAAVHDAQIHDWCYPGDPWPWPLEYDFSGAGEARRLAITDLGCLPSIPSGPKSLNPPAAYFALRLMSLPYLRMIGAAQMLPSARRLPE